MSNELTWTRFRTSLPRSRTEHYSNTDHGVYIIIKVGKTYGASYFPLSGGEVFVVTRPTLKETKRECGYHHNATDNPKGNS